MEPVRAMVVQVVVLVGLLTVVGCAAPQTASWGPRAGQPWRGVHVLAGNTAAIKALRTEVPRLAAIGVNLLVVEVNYGYAYESHPELRQANPITRDEARALAATCRQHGIRLIPQFQCLGHQSWKEHTAPLLAKHPEFDETPGQFPDNKDIYCRSWCPLHPDVNPLIFDLMDELIDAFQADALHVGMDEVFLIASEHCPRCKGKDPAELFARAVTDYHRHLVGKRKLEMLMWGDRLIQSNDQDKYSASQNGTAAAVDRIPTDIIICDWHYGAPRRPSSAYASVPMFLAKGFRVWPAGWKQAEGVEAFIDFSRSLGQPRLLGFLCTTWGEVKMEALSQWPPIRLAMKKLGGLNESP